MLKDFRYLKIDFTTDNKSEECDVSDLWTWLCQQQTSDSQFELRFSTIYEMDYFLDKLIYLIDNYCTHRSIVLHNASDKKMPNPLMYATYFMVQFERLTEYTTGSWGQNYIVRFKVLKNRFR